MTTKTWRATRFLTLASAAGLALVSLGSLTGCRGTTSEQPPIHLNPNMDNQKRFDPQERNPLFADGRSMRPDVSGTMPASTATPDPVFETGKVGDQFTATLPVGIVLDRALLERGQQRYDVYCTPCHDSTGSGKGSVSQRAGTWQPPSFHDDRLRAQPDGYFYDVMTNGIRTMPSYAAQIPKEDRWAVAAYVRTLQRSFHATKDQVPADVATQRGW